MKNDFERAIASIIQQLRIDNVLVYIDKIYLFGSRARGDANERSDIDLAVICDQNSSKVWLNITESIENAETLLKIDVINFADAAAEFKQKILKEGKVIYERAKDTAKSGKFR